MNLLFALKLMTLLGAGAIGGLFFAFSTSVMKALVKLPPPHGITVMQRINEVILNALFLGVFMGTAVLSLVCIAVFFLPLGDARSGWLLAAGLLYLSGTFCVTVVFNVPRDQRLARLEAESADAAKYWASYLKEWTFWNHVRGAMALAAVACAAISIVN